MYLHLLYNNSFVIYTSTKKEFCFKSPVLQKRNFQNLIMCVLLFSNRVVILLVGLGQHNRDRLYLGSLQGIAEY